MQRTAAVISSDASDATSMRCHCGTRRTSTSRDVCRQICRRIRSANYYTQLCLLAVLIASPQQISGDTSSPQQQQQLQQPTTAYFLPTDPQNVTVSPGETAVLRCTVANIGGNTVTWRRQNDTVPMTIGVYPFAADPRINAAYDRYDNETGQWRLIIDDVTSADAGVYHCQMTSKETRNVTYDVRLYVRGIFIRGTDHVELGSAIRLQCNATGLNPDRLRDVNWFRNGVQLRSDARIGILVTKKVDLTSRSVICGLIVQWSRSTDAGEYVCRTARMPRESASITVRVNGVSASPVVGSLTGSAKSNFGRHTHTSSLVVLSLIAAVAFTKLNILCSTPTESSSDAMTSFPEATAALHAVGYWSREWLL